MQYCLNMDEYEAKKANGGEITALDTLVYYKSKSASGEELTASDIAELKTSSGIVIDEATDGILQNIKNNIKTSTRDDTLADLAVLSAFDTDDAKAAQSWLAGVREADKKLSYEKSLIKSIEEGDTGTYEVTKSGELLRDGEKIDIVSIDNKELKVYFKSKWAETQQSQHEGNIAQGLPVVDDTVLAPVIGVKTLVTGKDQYDEEATGIDDKGFAAAAIFLPFFSKAKTGEKVVEEVVEHSDDIVKAVGKVVENNSGKIEKVIANEADDVIKVVSETKNVQIPDGSKLEKIYGSDKLIKYEDIPYGTISIENPKTGEYERFLEKSTLKVQMFDHPGFTWDK